MQITRGNYSNQHAREIIGEEMEKISKITSRSALAATYVFFISSFIFPAAWTASTKTFVLGFLVFTISASFS